MLLNVSYNNLEVKRKIDTQVGPPFTIRERLKMKGIGSSKLFITSASIEIHNLLILDSYINTCNIEMRPNGIIVGFRSLLESYALIIPYYKLSLYKGKAEEYSIFRDHYFIKIRAKANDKATHKFIKKIMDYKAENLPLGPEGL
ncbi:hypothetical protein [Leeuwenhoekiella marinoflava]|uniref:Uncharacterized protein n=2 Tax=Leeuwenhoekiella marinoflava TaxID=988 RepID=A0A4Q0PJL7_9FLAO|nr:hypothetical protein [Leeuwenhoekiella marinoflava]RXG27856.1 hypothetical protein DSL99_2647 [Leeuwenhoekiella marinoflava]SHF63251.1 hypothetical protein SAMN02745246_03035 [Leeuwenhoekiella marinoflava DSM 3653]